MLTTALSLVVALAIYTQAPAAPESQAPPPVGTTPGACLKEVRDYAAKKRAELPALPPANSAEQAMAQQSSPAGQQRSQALRQIEADRLGMAKACAAKFDVKTTYDSALADLASLSTEAALPELARATIDRALTVKTLPDADRASVLLQAVQIGMREPKSEERNARLEGLIDQLDRLPASAAFTQQWSAHQSIEGYYRADDIDAGIIRHAEWIIAAAKTFTPDQRAKMGLTVVSAHVNMAQAWAGQGMTGKAIDLLKSAKTTWGDIPRAVESYLTPEIERLELVGTVAAPLTAPRWLNLPGGQTTMDLKGKVTLLEFTAHWCGPCKESYPGVNRLRAKYGPQGFQVVLATALYGYFAQERPLDTAAEFDRDKTYFAEHGLDVPIAVGDRVTGGVVGGKVEYLPAPNPNDTSYKVGGIPQIMLIDKQGRIRLMMVGYDDANESKLAKMIESMIKEK